LDIETEKKETKSLSPRKKKKHGFNQDATRRLRQMPSGKCQHFDDFTSTTRFTTKSACAFGKENKQTNKQTSKESNREATNRGKEAM
jgi:hypothetical protein